MAMNVGGPQRAEMNVTPMIDILLVLIIIFLVVTPQLSHGLDAKVPEPSKSTKPEPVAGPLVVTVLRNGGVLMNREPVPEDEVQKRLELQFANGTRLMFLRAEKSAEGDIFFEQVAKVIDLAKGAGIPRIGLMTAHSTD